jgi:GAF domain-containing protein
MEPLPETLEVLSRISSTNDVDLVAAMAEETARLVDSVPGCVGVSITLRDDELTFTWLSTAPRLRDLDAAQFLSGGPCEDASGTGRAAVVPELMDEEQWRLLALAGAAVGVHSSLSMPLVGPRGPFGSVNFYGRQPDTFTGREREVAAIFGADVQSAVANADLSMSSRRRAEGAVQTLEASTRVDIASGILAEQEGITVEEARRRILAAAGRAGAPPLRLAEIVIESATPPPDARH